MSTTEPAAQAAEHRRYAVAKKEDRERWRLFPIDPIVKQPLATLAVMQARLLFFAGRRELA